MGFRLSKFPVFSVSWDFFWVSNFLTSKTTHISKFPTFQVSQFSDFPGSQVFGFLTFQVSGFLSFQVLNFLGSRVSRFLTFCISIFLGITFQDSDILNFQISRNSEIWNLENVQVSKSLHAGGCVTQKLRNLEMQTIRNRETRKSEKSEIYKSEFQIYLETGARRGTESESQKSLFIPGFYNQKFPNF